MIYESMYEVHVSGHACQEELKLIHGLTKPKYFIPVHGEQKHLRKARWSCHGHGHGKGKYLHRGYRQCTGAP